MAKFELNPLLREWATDRQWELMTAWAEHGTAKKAAEALNISISSILKANERTKRRAGQHGYAPERGIVHPTAPGMSSRGTSVLYGPDGEMKEYWNKSKQEGRDPDEVIRLPDPRTIIKLSTLYDQEGNVTQQWVSEKPEAIAQIHAWEECAKALTEKVLRAEPVEPPALTDEDLLAAYPIGDHHLGMLAWPPETKAPWDIDIGERVLNSAMSYLTNHAPPAHHGLIVFLGDFMHYDSTQPETPTSKNKVDADSRFGKMVRVAINTMKYAIARALDKHALVTVIVEVGNHDLYSSIFLMECLANIYEHEPRVTIDTSPMHFHYYRFGEVLIGTHHGHGTRMQNLPLIMAADRKEDWGATTHRYWWTGHLHYSKTQAAVSGQDFTGCSVEQFRVLPPEDAWARQKGYRAIRSMKSIVLHKKFGEVSRNTVNPEMFLVGDDLS